ncbi:hypothetical protein PG990_014723 [Apiospora arundinis]
MDSSNAPEVDKTADHPEVVWNHLRDPEPYVPTYSPQSQTQQPLQQQQYAQQQPEQQQYQQQQQYQSYQQTDQQHQYQQTLPDSQMAHPAGTAAQPSYGYVVGQSSSHGSGANEKGGEPERKATIYGMSRTFFIALVVLAVVTIAAAIGGGVGGSMAVRSAYNEGAKGASNDIRAGAASESSSSVAAAAAATSAASPTISGGSTVTSTAGGLFTAPTAGVQLALDCPKLTGEKVTIKFGSDYEASFTLACGLDKPGRGFDLFSATVYTYTDCMRLCVSYNRASRSKSYLSDNVAKVYANCFLKNTTSDMSSATDRFMFASLNP